MGGNIRDERNSIMKKTVRILAATMALLMVCFVFASCGTISGTYSNEVEAFGIASGTTFTFKGNKVSMTIKVAGMSSDPIEGTYKIKGDKITFTFKGDSKDAEKWNQELSFEKTDAGIKIGGVEYKKK